MHMPSARSPVQLSLNMSWHAVERPSADADDPTPEWSGQRTEGFRCEVTVRVQTSPVEAGGVPYSLLITDDDEAFRVSLRAIFETEGFRTYLARSGEEAIDIVHGQPVHLALMDQHMPRLTGLETLRIIRQQNLLLPAILVTGESSEQLLREALSAQVFSVLSKPVSRNLVVYTVQRALARYYDQSRSAAIGGQQGGEP